MPALHFFRDSVTFSRKTKGPNLVRKSVSIRRNRPSQNPRVLLALTGFEAMFSQKHNHVKEVYILPALDEPGPFGDGVDIRVAFGLRDSSGNWDDPYEGSADIGLIVVDDDTLDASADGVCQFPYSSGCGPMSLPFSLAGQVAEFPAH